MDRKPFTMIIEFRHEFNRVIKIEHANELETRGGAIHAYTNKEMYIIPLDIITYAKMIEEKEEEESGTTEAD